MKKGVIFYFTITGLILISSYILLGENFFSVSRSDRRILNFLILIVIVSVLLIYNIVLSTMLYSKNKKAEESLKDFERYDIVWNKESMKERIEEIFFEVQKAWTARDQNLAKGSLTQKMFEEHKAKTDELINSGVINMLESIKLIEAKIISVADFKDDSKDVFSSHIKGKMINYIIDDKTKKLVSGDDKHYEPFEEIWHFKREGNKWMLNEIDQKVTIYSLLENSPEEKPLT